MGVVANVKNHVDRLLLDIFVRVTKHADREILKMSLVEHSFKDGENNILVFFGEGLS
jgi:hypothetical protein